MDDNTSDVKKMINCSFCGKGRFQVEQLIEGPAFHGKNIYICNECVDVTYGILHAEESTPAAKKKKEKIPTPEQSNVAQCKLPLQIKLLP